MANITWTPEMLERFRKDYETALRVKGKDGTFPFDGNLFVVAYAGYLIEYLEGMFQTKKVTG